ncbi:urease accessory protein UreD [Segetibacter sp. 3557_3]|uniref:urease accessory protein UreD n=1 Tax=Segetibacter sp. 3557_3 TaxID=2547429 RepID=UPI001058FE19|nr:urease accessory protein UreD [Segetibacter sp. 3557_3]TDH27314.1 urease accessory protein UreD [Segetibacter sp. 3557_3]
MSGRIHIIASGRGKTRLKQAFFSQPFKVANITEGRNEQELTLMMMSSSPGILEKDCYDIRIEVEEGASLKLLTQGYQRIFTMAGSARQTTTVLLAEGASLTYLPHPVVPHRNADFGSINEIHLGRCHHLTWSEIITCGRKLSDEVFQFRRYHSVTNIYIGEKLVVRENLLVEPGIINPAQMGQLEGFTHQASFVCLNNKIDCKVVIARCREMLENYTGIAYGVSLLPVNGIVARVLGYKAEQLHDINKALSEVVNALTRTTVQPAL